MEKKKVLRKDLLPKRCDRCGNDFMTGQVILYLPFRKMYIGLCPVCAKGIGNLSELVSRPNVKSKEEDVKRWKEFWEEEII